MPLPQCRPTEHLLWANEIGEKLSYIKDTVVGKGAPFQILPLGQSPWDPSTLRDRWLSPNSTDGLEGDQWHRLEISQTPRSWGSGLPGWLVGVWLIWGHESLHRLPVDSFLRTEPLDVIQMMRFYRISPCVRRFCSIGLEELAENAP